MTSSNAVPIVIVGFRNPSEIVECLTALDGCLSDPPCEVLVCENGGAAAFDALVAALTADDAPCVPAQGELSPLARGGEKFTRVANFRLRRRGSLVAIAQACENLGYAGAINAWLSLLLTRTDWPGVWILNPDTQPAPDALAEFVAYAQASGKGMIGGRVLLAHRPDVVQTRGLRWRKLVATTEAVDRNVSAAIAPDIAEVEQRLDAPSGASVYVTRACVEKIGLMDDRYFLYFEDLDWGLRAKAQCGLGYAWRAVVYHHGGTTIGSAATHAARSPLAVYLEFRNSVLFVRARYPRWLAWTVCVGALRAAEFGLAKALTNMKMAYRGLFDGLIGRTGRPDAVLEAHLARAAQAGPETERRVERY
jgi:GT2 family glycosyltransferase